MTYFSDIYLTIIHLSHYHSFISSRALIIFIVLLNYSKDKEDDPFMFSIISFILPYQPTTRASYSRCSLFIGYLDLDKRLKSSLVCWICYFLWTFAYISLKCSKFIFYFMRTLILAISPSSWLTQPRSFRLMMHWSWLMKDFLWKIKAFSI